MIPFCKKLSIVLVLTHIFILTCAFSDASAAEKPGQGTRIVLESTHNTRGLDGYLTAGNKRISKGLIYRSDGLEALTENDLRQLDELGIKTVIDFRTATERNKAPNRLPSSVKQVFYPSIDAEGTIDMSRVTRDSGAEFMQQGYRVIINEKQAPFHEFFKIVSNKDNLPVLFHCASGKDRTGLAAALFLSALGVNREDIFREYLLSANLVRDKHKAFVAENPHMEALMTVHREYLEAAFDEIAVKHGGMNNYLVKQLGVNREMLRKIYTY
jgi:Protein tyrosine/serine phosphatase